MERLPLEPSIDVLSRVLPARALQYIRETNDVFAAGDVAGAMSDSEILSALVTAQIPIIRIVRGEVLAILERKGVPQEAPDVFSVVDAEMRGERNPLLSAVRSALGR